MRMSGAVEGFRIIFVPCVLAVLAALVAAAAARKSHLSNTTAAALSVSDSQAIASVLDLRGNVRFREMGDFVFKPLRPQQILSRYSTIYTESDGWVSLLFSGDQTSVVSVPPNSIFRLEDQLPISMLLRRGFTRAKSDFLIDQIESHVLSKDSQITVAGVQDTGEYMDVADSELQRTKAVRFGLRMALEMKRIPVSFPVNNLYVWSNPPETPAKAPVLFSAELREPLQGYLWQVRPLTRVVWSGLISQKSKQVVMTIPTPGTYLFQAFGKSGLSRTRSIRIHVGDKKKNFTVFPNGIVRGDSILYN